MKHGLELLLIAIAIPSLTATSAAEPEPAEPPPPEITADEDRPDEPGRGDFDAGGQVRLPSGPDEMGEFATFNWIALDLAGRYFLLDWVTARADIPLAVIKPDDFGGQEPSLIGGARLGLEVELPKMPFQPSELETEIGLILRGAYMREGAMLLSPRDFPLYTGDFKPGFAAGAYSDIALSSLLSVSVRPLLLYQAGTSEAITAIQLPTSTTVKLGSLVKLSADLGLFTGDDFSLSGDDGGRLSAGASLAVKLGPILVHTGAGAASLLTGGLYPEIGDSLYIDLDVKYVR